MRSRATFSVSVSEIEDNSGSGEEELGTGSVVQVEDTEHPETATPAAPPVERPRQQRRSSI